MDTELQKQLNAAWWAQIAGSVGARYEAPLHAPASTANPAELVDDGFYLLAAGRHPELAARLLDAAIEAARRDLAAGEFPWQRVVGFKPVAGAVPGSPFSAVVDEEYVPIPEEARSAQAEGKSASLRALHDALWLRTGERSAGVWRTCIQAHEDLAALQPAGGWSETLVGMYVEAEDYAPAIGLFESTYGRQPTPWVQRQALRSQPIAMYLIARYAAGEAGLAAAAETAIHHWYAHSQVWDENRSDLPWRQRLRWAYLHGRYTTGTTELSILLEGLANR